MPMNKELKAKWVADLRRDDIRQCTGVLQDDTGANCCLGRLYIVAGVKPDTSEVEVMFNGRETYPSEEDLETWGLTDEHATDLYRRNDGGLKPNLNDFYDEHSFKEIADYIENNPDI